MLKLLKNHPTRNRILICKSFNTTLTLTKSAKFIFFFIVLVQSSCNDSVVPPIDNRCDETDSIGVGRLLGLENGKKTELQILLFHLILIFISLKRGNIYFLAPIVEYIK